jgi:hypothetical protein
MGDGEREALLFLQQASGQILKDDVNGFSSSWDICFFCTYHLLKIEYVIYEFASVPV